MSDPRFLAETNNASARGTRATSTGPVATPGQAPLTKMWAFAPSRVPLWVTRRRLGLAARHWCRPPTFQVVKPASARERWIVYFMYCPEGETLPHHLFTMTHLRELDLPILAVCATPPTGSVPRLCLGADSIIVKALNGYDFSAYSIALGHLSRHSPGADVFLLNDSMLGPFSDLRPFFDSAKWDLTGLTSSEKIENHIQTYGFFLRKLTPRILRQLGGVFSRHISFDRHVPVVYLQETRMARLAYRHMSVGSFWHEGSGLRRDPTLFHALSLAADGFPFVKRSLLGRHAAKKDVAQIRSLLRDHGHPLS